MFDPQVIVSISALFVCDIPNVSLLGSIFLLLEGCSLRAELIDFEGMTTSIPKAKRMGFHLSTLGRKCEWPIVLLVICLANRLWLPRVSYSASF